MCALIWDCKIFFNKRIAQSVVYQPEHMQDILHRTKYRFWHSRLVAIANPETTTPLVCADINKLKVYRNFWYNSESEECNFVALCIE